MITHNFIISIHFYIVSVTIHIYMERVSRHLHVLKTEY